MFIIYNQSGYALERFPKGCELVTTIDSYYLLTFFT